MENEQAKFEGWAIVEMMGHQREIGFVTTEAYGVAVLFRVDVPEIPEHEYILERPEYGEDQGAVTRLMPVGTKVLRVGKPARSRLVSPAAVYAINPCTEEAARKAIASSSSRPLILIELPKGKALPPKDDEPQDAIPETQCGILSMPEYARGRPYSGMPGEEEEKPQGEEAEDLV